HRHHRDLHSFPTRRSSDLCISVQRVLLHRPIYNETLERLLDKIASLKVGDPRDPDTVVGPMIDERAAADAFATVQEALEGGAQVDRKSTRLNSSHVKISYA